MAYAPHASHEGHLAKALVALVAAVAAAFAIAASLPAHAHAADREVVQVVDGVTTWIGDEAALQKAIDDAGTKPVRIVLGCMETPIDTTLKIPAGADIELVNNPHAIFGDATSTLARADGFKGVMVRVEQGASLTLAAHEDGGRLQISSRGESIPSSVPAVVVKGALVMNDADAADADQARVKIFGARGMDGNYEGAVTVTGAQASFTMNGGAIYDNRRLQDPSRAQYGAGNVAVADGATFTLNGGLIADGYGSAVNGDSYGDVGGVGVFKGAHFTMNGGTIVRNRGFVGGVEGFVWFQSPNSRDELEAVAETNRAHIRIEGGMIADNEAGFGGGALLVLGNAEAVMNGGSMLRNSAPNGGAVNAMDLYVWGAKGSWEEVPGEGSKLGYAPEEFSAVQPGGFVMNGGTIDGNSASRTGGGVNVVSNAVKLNAGTIANNTARQMGGGVYVATKSYAVRIDNALVKGNSTNYVGGGVWTCPTGSVQLNVTNGAAVFGNAADYYGDDIAHDQYGGTGVQEIVLAERLIGGGAVDYYYDNASARFDAANPQNSELFKREPGATIDNRGLHAVATDAAKDAAASAACLVIEGNSAHRGGGVGTNGRVVFGEPGSFDAELDKTWVNAETGAALDAADIPATEVYAGVFRVGGNGCANGGGAADEWHLLQVIELSKDNGWKATITGLPEKDAKGTPLTYVLCETDAQGVPLKNDDGTYLAQDSFDASDPKAAIVNKVTPEKPPVPPTPDKPPVPPTPEKPPVPPTADEPPAPTPDKPAKAPKFAATGDSAVLPFAVAAGLAAAAVAGGAACLARRRS